MTVSPKNATRNQKEDLRAAHRNWKSARRRRQCQDYSTMLYWQQATSCAAL